MDALDLQLILGRAPALSAQQLRAALALILDTPDSTLSGDSNKAPGAASGIEPLAALVGERSRVLAALELAPAARRWLRAPDLTLIEADRRWVARERIHLIVATGVSYPPLLGEIAAAPAVLYVQGDPQVLSTPQLAVVGSRNPTAPAHRTAGQFAAFLARTGLTITSGLALGIDGASHEGALAAGGHTIAVLGSALDRLYPPQHRGLATRIVAHGALVSQFPPGTPALRNHFPRRNRIISGLTLGTLVVEATRRSGSLVTARMAAEQGREVFAIPGSIHNPLSHGCHELIRSGATLVETAEDVLRELRFPIVKQSITLQAQVSSGAPQGPSALDKDFKILLDALGFEAAGVDMLVERTGLPSQSVASMLLILELEGRVGLHAGGRYMRLGDNCGPIAAVTRTD